MAANKTCGGRFSRGGRRPADGRTREFEVRLECPVYLVRVETVRARDVDDAIEAALRKVPDDGSGWNEPDGGPEYGEIKVLSVR